MTGCETDGDILILRCVFSQKRKISGWVAFSIANLLAVC